MSLESKWAALFMGRDWVGSAAYRAAIGAIIQTRMSCGVSQRELARRLGRPPSYINKIELLERRLDLLEFIQIARALGADANELLSKILEALPQDDAA
jgi:transcriptional regulator with XRE-family HTH domain